MMNNPDNVDSQPMSIDPLTPGEIAARLEAVCSQRASLPTRTLILLGLLGGLYIGMGGALATLVLTDSSLGYGVSHLVGGIAFSVGLIMLVIAGGELFTGNNLMVLSLVSRKVSKSALARNWGVVYVTNAAGAILLAFAMHQSGVLDGGGLAAAAIKIAEAKAHLAASSAFVRGTLCNMLVCLAVWMSISARSLEGKVLAILFPISAFVALGFEHCIANFYLIPIGILSGAQVSAVDLVRNLVAVTLGNVTGGAALAIAYWFVYLDGDHARLQGLALHSEWWHWARKGQAARSTLVHYATAWLNVKKLSQR
jgi:formate/nitrite transporter